jgi:diaminopropionate ammonia-lyase
MPAMTATPYFVNQLPSHGQPLDPRDAETLSVNGADRVLEVLALREAHAPTPLHALPGLARELGIGCLHVKDVGFGLGLGSF